MLPQILTILDRLISFKSVTPQGLDALEFIADYLKPLGFKCLIKTFGPKDEVANLYAVRGNQAPNICFAGHVDVVPPLNEDLWQSDPFKMTIKDDNIVVGRGVVDMKGAIACALAAVEKFIREYEDHNGSISFLLTTDEEGDGTYGLQKMLEYIKDTQPKIDFCILGEPTTRRNIGDTIKIGRRGSINFDLKIKGKQGHVAYPDKAINPMPIKTKILYDLVTNKLDDGTEFFQSSNLEITSMEGVNLVTNIIPESVKVKFNIRFNDHHTPQTLIDRVTGVIEQYSSAYELHNTCSSLPFIQAYSKQMQCFADLVQQETNIKPDIETNGGTSDARFIHRYAQVVEFGLNCNPAHQINEYSTIYDLQILANVYYNSLVKFLEI